MADSGLWQPGSLELEGIRHTTMICDNLTEASKETPLSENAMLPTHHPYINHYIQPTPKS